MKRNLIILLLPLLIIVQISWADGTAYDAAMKGKQCKETANQMINCTYKIGKDLEFTIDGVGMPDTGITFLRTKGLEGDYYPTFGLRHGCIILKHGKNSELFGIDYAFISPKNGKVYKDWGECKNGF